MDWDLFVDESGDFEPSKRCLVGGFICPRGAVNENKMAIWKNEILSIPMVQEMSARFGGWNYDHCKDNRVDTRQKKQLRGALQLTILKEYIKRIEAISGKIVIFDNASGSYNIDNTTNFLTVLAKGLMALYYDLQSKDAAIHLRFSSRSNNIYWDSPSEIPISPTRVMEAGKRDTGVILASQYKAQIKNLAFLQGGQWLLSNQGFSSMIDTMEILYKTRKNNIERENPFTIPCDYICNTLLNANAPGNEYRAEIEQLYHSPACLYYETDKPLQPGFNGIPAWDSETDNGATLFSLISMDFPEPATGNFFRCFNAASPDTQKIAVDHVIRALYEKVDCQKAMGLLAERLGHTIETAEQIKNEEIRHVFIANLLLYQKSLYTHLGDQHKMESITDAFHAAIEKIENAAEQDHLMLLADNRRLVDLTDCFDYDTAIHEFEEIERYWEQTIVHRQRRLSGTLEKPKYPDYGKTVGSYLQLLRQLIHQSAPEEKKLYYAEAVDHYEAGRYHLLETKDIIRYYENVSDIESEMGHYQAAFDHLYRAATLEENPDVEPQKDFPVTKDNATRIIEEAGYDGDKHPYLLQHYVRLLSMMFLANGESPEAETLLAPLLPEVSASFGEKINSPHPKTQMQWKIASALAGRKASTTEEKLLAGKLFSAAVQALLNQGKPVFSAIAVGVLAEQIWHIRKGRIPGNASSVYKALKRAYLTFLSQKTDSEKNPFYGLLPDDPAVMPAKLSPETCEALFWRIGY